MRKCGQSATLELTGFGLCKFCYFNSILLILCLEMIASSLSYCLHVIFSESVISSKDWIFTCCIFSQCLTSSRGKQNAKTSAW